MGCIKKINFFILLISLFSLSSGVNYKIENEGRFEINDPKHYLINKSEDLDSQTSYINKESIIESQINNKIDEKNTDKNKQDTLKLEKKEDAKEEIPINKDSNEKIEKIATNESLQKKDNQVYNPFSDYNYEVSFNSDSQSKDNSEIVKINLEDYKKYENDNIVNFDSKEKNCLLEDIKINENENNYLRIDNTRRIIDKIKESNGNYETKILIKKLKENINKEPEKLREKKVEKIVLKDVNLDNIENKLEINSNQNLLKFENLLYAQDANNSPFQNANSININKNNNQNKKLKSRRYIMDDNESKIVDEFHDNTKAEVRSTTSNALDKKTTSNEIDITKTNLDTPKIEVQKDFNKALKDKIKDTFNSRVENEEKIAEIKSDINEQKKTQKIKRPSFFNDLFSKFKFPEPIERLIRNYRNQNPPPNIFKKSYDKENRHLEKSVSSKDLYISSFTVVKKKDSRGKLSSILDEVDDLNIQDVDGNTLLHKTASSNKEDTTSLLLLKGSNPNILNNNGFSPLHISSSNGNYEVSQELILGGADINMKDLEGNTALMYAVASSNLKLVKLICSSGGFIDIKNNKGVTVFDVAKSCENKMILVYLNKVKNKIN